MGKSRARRWRSHFPPSHPGFDPGITLLVKFKFDPKIFHGYSVLKQVPHGGASKRNERLESIFIKFDDKKELNNRAILAYRE